MANLPKSFKADTSTAGQRPTSFVPDSERVSEASKGVELDANQVSQLSENVRGGRGGVALGIAKGALETARLPGQLVQGLGQRAIAAFDPTRTLEEVRAETGIKSISKFRPEGQKIEEQLEAKGRAEEIGKGLETAGELLIGGVPIAKALVTKGIPFVQKTLSNVLKQVSKGAKPKQEIIQDLISPKITSKETQKIIAESRVERGKEGFFFGRRPDLVTQSGEIKEAGKIIERRIPGADELDDFALNTKMGEEISTISKDLVPRMEAVSIKPKTTQQATKVWDDLKKQQALEPEFEAFAGSKRVQKNFQAFIDETKTPVKDAKTGKFREKNLNDFWNIRKRYDASIRSGVKQANDQSAPSLQLQKEMWLENRAILNDMINDTAKGLGKVSEGAFDDMSHLYMSRQNIATKSKIITEADPGLISTKNLIRFGLGVGGATILGQSLF